MNIETIPSPHHNSRDGYEPRACVIHYTAGGNGTGTAIWFRSPVSRASAHYVITRNGRVIQCVDHDRAAWHCEPAAIVIDGECYDDANEVTIGIELANWGWLHRKGERFYGQIRRKLVLYDGPDPEEGVTYFDNGHEVHGFWEPYPNEQLDALQELLRHIAIQCPEAAQNLIGHEDIAMPLGRKIDPGPAFPWGRFYSKLTRRVMSRGRMIG